MNSRTDIIKTEKFDYLTLTNDFFARSALQMYGEMSVDETDLLCELIAKDAMVLDVGANIGIHTLALAEKASEGEVWAFEPLRFLHQILCANVVMNGFTNVRVFQCALGREPAVLPMAEISFDNPDCYGGFELRKYLDTSEKSREGILVSTLDSLGLKDIDLIKIDVDGMDEDVLRGGFKTIFECRPYLYVEVDDKDRRQGLIGFMRTLGYELFEHFPPLIRAETPLRPELESQLSPGDLANAARLKACWSPNFLCVPSEKARLSEEFIARHKLIPNVAKV